MFRKRINLGGRSVGPGQPTFLVAELSGNHNGDIERALDTIRAAAEVGCDAVKFQTYTADSLTIECNNADFVVPGDGPWSGRSLYDLYEEAHTPWAWHERLFEVARDEGLIPFSTPFDAAAVDFLEELDCPAYKIASFELIDDFLLRSVANTGRPIVLSTGMATLEEIDHALAVLEGEGCESLVVLRCTSAYPAPDNAMDLRSIPNLQERIDAPVGLSDHSAGLAAPVAAIALGAVMIEKHLTLSRDEGGVDSHFSLEPAEFADLVREVRRVDTMLGSVRFGAVGLEEESLVFRRSLYFVTDLEVGSVVGRSAVRSIRPGYGIAPRFLDDVVGRTVNRAVTRGTRVTWDLLDE